MYRLAHRLHIGLDMLWRIGSVLFVSGIPKHVPCFLFFLRNAISHFAINLLENKKQIFHIGISATNLSHIRVRKPFLPSCFRSPESLFRSFLDRRKWTPFDSILSGTRPQLLAKRSPGVSQTHSKRSLILSFTNRQLSVMSPQMYSL